MPKAYSSWAQSLFSQHCTCIHRFEDTLWHTQAECTSYFPSRAVLSCFFLYSAHAYIDQNTQIHAKSTLALLFLLRMAHVCVIWTCKKRSQAEHHSVFLNTAQSNIFCTHARYSTHAKRPYHRKHSPFRFSTWHMHTRIRMHTPMPKALSYWAQLILSRPDATHM